MSKIPLTEDEANQIGGALHRLQEIGSSTIVNPNAEAEQKGTVQFLQRILVEHADELLASWLAVHYEYEPLVGSFAALLSRATGVIQRSNAQRAAAQQADKNTEPAPDNIVPLKKCGMVL